MPERSKRILYDEKKLKQINAENKKLMQKYTIDMSLRELSPKTIYQYQKDLEQWFVYILDNQENKCVTELSDDDITEFFYFCKMQGNNTERMKLEWLLCQPSTNSYVKRNSLQRTLWSSWIDLKRVSL